MAVVGPGSSQIKTDNPRPLLEDATEYDYVTIFNPLTDDFQCRVAQEVPVNMPFEIRDKTAMVQSERDVTLQYGLSLKNPEHKAMKYIYNETIIPAGGSLRFKGSDAKVVIKQLVDEILQRTGKTRLMHDPHVRNEVERDIIQDSGSIQDIMDGNLTTPQQQINEAIRQKNEVNSVQPDATAFPGLDGAADSEAEDAGNSAEPVNTTEAEPTKKSRGKAASK